MTEVLVHNGHTRNDREGHPTGSFTLRGEYPDGLPAELWRVLHAHACILSAQMDGGKIAYIIDIIVGCPLPPDLQVVWGASKERNATGEDVARARGMIVGAAFDCVKKALSTQQTPSSN